MIDVLRTVAEVRARRAALSSDRRTLALVPTMGFLHEGHLALMREGRRRADACAATIFVNPTQFGPREDLSRYPRDEAGDVAKCESAGISFVWAPDVSEVYPDGFQTWVEVGELTREHCGRSRPTHFRGVTTVVAKIFNVVRPDVAVFGEKDYQQLQVVRRMAKDLDFGIDIVGVPTVREPDGLATSSRNALLKGADRQRALALHRGLLAAVQMRANGETQASRLAQAARAELALAGVREDYVAVVDPTTLTPLETLAGPARVLIAGFVDGVRLIDNASV